MVIVVLTFIGVFGLIVGAYWAFVVVPERKARTAWRQRLGGTDWGGPAAAAPESRIITERPASSVERLNKLLGNRRQLTERVQRALDRAGVRLTPAAFVLACLFVGMLFYVLFRNTPFMVRLVTALLGGSVPVLYLRYRESVRRRKFEELFPEAIEVIARALRAGHTFTTGVAMAAEEVADPVGSEFKLIYEWQNYGRPLDEALRAFADRAPILDARFFVTAVLTQRETGGNLSELLDNLVAVIRDRFMVKRQVRVFTAQGRLSGWILSLAPPVLAGLLLLINPEHMLTLVRDPIGMQMLIAAAVLQIAGTLMIRRIVNVEY